MDYVYPVFVRNEVVAIGLSRYGAEQVLEQREQEYQLENNYSYTKTFNNNLGSISTRYYDDSDKLVQWFAINRVRKDLL